MTQFGRLLGLLLVKEILLEKSKWAEMMMIEHLSAFASFESETTA